MSAASPIATIAPVSTLLTSVDVTMAVSILINLIYFVLPVIINYKVAFYLILSVTIACATVTYEHQKESEFRHLLIGNMILGASFIWHTLPIADVPSEAKIYLTAIQLGLLGTYFTTAFRMEILFLLSAFWLVPYDNFAEIDQPDLHVLVLLYSLFWGIHELFVVKYFGVRQPLQDSVVISLVMFRVIGPGLVIYFAAVNVFKGYLAWKTVMREREPNKREEPQDIEAKIVEAEPPPEVYETPIESPKPAPKPEIVKPPPKKSAVDALFESMETIPHRRNVGHAPPVHVESFEEFFPPGPPPEPVQKVSAYREQFFG